ncbi:MAG: 3-deoxy-manno-octulosonate cytidylyltransferase [Planctomycetes bacterium]|nr:3-deoxy-manno-octulosonate cytidylyltransferase [Planctomycetota bacterium]
MTAAKSSQAASSQAAPIQAAPIQALAIIPVRVGSQRLPGKALLTESGKALFLHTCDQARKARNIDRVCVATDDDTVERLARQHDFLVVRTSPQCRTGSERCAEAAAAIPCRAVLDIQGDWPEVDPRDLEAIVDQLLRGEAVCNTLCVPLHDPEVMQNPNVVKVVRGLHGKALYFSRAVVPFQKEGTYPILRHIGVYGFQRETLLRIPPLPSSGLAETESLEQLRFLENDIPMHVLDAKGDPWGIETRSDYDAFLARLQRQ